MRYRRLGASGVKVSAVGLGSWLTYGTAVEEETARDCVRVAFESGVNFFDTADVYAKGAAEEFLGRALSDFRREDLVVATKVFGAMSDGVNDRGLSRKHIMESCAASLRRLRLETIDLYQCHRYDPEVSLPEVVRAMDDLIRQGKVLYWGVSEWSAEQIRAACEVARDLRAPPPVSNQPLYNMLERGLEDEVLGACKELGVGQVVYSPLAQGLLTGKYQGGRVPAGSRLANDQTNRFMKRRVTAENLARVERVLGIARELGVAPATLALAWCLRDENVASVITGATQTAQVRENVAAADLELSDEVLARIDDALAADTEAVGP
ncbi:MAG: aldo/keto reductase [Planctomycetota bacterium]|nr:MAG: aldo/keto reductase [Planctomycetota bacterium]